MKTSLKTKHTPGQYYLVEAFKTEGGLWEASVNCDEVTIAVCKATTKERAEANARLIAAALTSATSES